MERELCLREAVAGWADELRAMEEERASAVRRAQEVLELVVHRAAGGLRRPLRLLRAAGREERPAGRRGNARAWREGRRRLEFPTLASQERCLRAIGRPRRRAVGVFSFSPIMSFRSSSTSFKSGTRTL